jgi:hypothetical protein
MPIVVADNPLYSVVQGSGMYLENFKVLKGMGATNEL